MPDTRGLLRLKPHQLDGVSHILSREYAITGAGTGTGKTGMMAWASKMALEELEPVMNIVPNSIMQQTLEEYEFWHGQEWARQHVVQLHSMAQKDRADLLRRTRRQHDIVVIASHEMLSNKEVAAALESRTWALTLVDEGSRFRNDSARSRALGRLRKVSGIRNVMSGTLVVRNRGDLWYPGVFLKQGLFSGITQREIFMRHFFTFDEETQEFTEKERPEHRAELDAIVNAITWRVQLSDVRDMPARTITRRVVDMSLAQRRAYAELRDTLTLEIEREDDKDFKLRVRHYVTRIQRLQEIAAGFARNASGDIYYIGSSKTEELGELLQDGTPSIVWTWWVPERDAVVDRLRNIHISVTRDRAYFNAGQAQVIVMSPASGGYGMNLDRAERMIYHSLPWDLDLYIQSQERNWRLTTTKPKEIVHLVSRDTIDERVLGKLIAKARISERAMGKSDALAFLR
jgi:SNF2 family DNA or RNA helicase